MIRLNYIFDTIMMNLNQRETRVLSLFLKKREMQSSDVYDELLKLGEDISLVTVKRVLSKMAEMGTLAVRGSGRATTYEVSVPGRIFADVNAREYISIEPDRRYGLNSYNFSLFPSLPRELFSGDELKGLDNLTAEYNKKTKDISPVLQKKELERLVIELSWKSSKIEGNTYTLLDTEKLILENKEAVGKSRAEAQMILNHKDAFSFIHENKSVFKTITRGNLEKLHNLLVKGLDVGAGLRKSPVGISGSIYRPLDNVYQIDEAVENLFNAVNGMETPYAKSIVSLLGISYIQPFEDGNKRTGRLMADALLMANGCAPLSYRSVDENEYREAVLVFYELNSVVPFKKIFIEQYEFGARNYAAK